MKLNTFIFAFFAALFALSAPGAEALWGSKMGQLECGLLVDETRDARPSQVNCVVLLADRATNKVVRRLYAPPKQELVSVTLSDAAGQMIKPKRGYNSPLGQYSRETTRKLRALFPRPEGQQVTQFDPRDIFNVNRPGDYLLTLELRVLQDFGGDALSPLVFPILKTNVFLKPKAL